MNGDFMGVPILYGWLFFVLICFIFLIFHLLESMDLLG